MHPTSSICASNISDASDAHNTVLGTNMLHMLLTKNLTELTLANQNITKQEVLKNFDFEYQVRNFVDEVTLKAKKHVQFFFDQNTNNFATKV